MFDSPFTSYAYSYPHKSAYRAIDPPVPLSRVWSEEKQDALFLYAHVPFCEFRCGFCNLFTLARPAVGLPDEYLRALRRQARQVREAVPGASFARIAIGGGTPTFLEVHQLAELTSIIGDVMGVDACQVPAACEASPATIDRDKLQLLREFGIDRLSLGVQSFDDTEVHAMGRPQKSADVHRAIRLIRELDFPTLNLDLIYGGQQQTVPSWLRSVSQAIEYQAEEIYLYPLYVRDLTGLGKVSPLGELAADRRRWDDERLTAYREARWLLLASGYRQVSLRMFRLDGASDSTGPVYCCQTDGMLGLGCGARSYTERLHYSYEYAVGSRVVRGILDDYLSRDRGSFSQVEFGIQLDVGEQRRRYIIMSLLQCAGMSVDAYTTRFGTDPVDDFPMLLDLETNGLMGTTDGRLVLTEAGIEYSDAIGPWLKSAAVQQREASYQWR